MSEAGTRLTLANLGGSTGFRSDARFTICEAPPPPDTLAEPDDPPEDPVALAYAEGLAIGAAKARADAAETAHANDEARAALALSFARLDDQMAEELRLRLRDTVAALCEAAIAPLALDETALMARIKRGVSMLARVDDERLIQLHPDDLALVAPRLLQEWTVQPDPTLTRGAIRVEAANGGVADGPEQWRCAITEALEQC